MPGFRGHFKNRWDASFAHNAPAGSRVPASGQQRLSFIEHVHDVVFGGETDDRRPPSRLRQLTRSEGSYGHDPLPVRTGAQIGTLGGALAWVTVAAFALPVNLALGVLSIIHEAATARNPDIGAAATTGFTFLPFCAGRICIGAGRLAGMGAHVIATSAAAIGDMAVQAEIGKGEKATPAIVTPVTQPARADAPKSWRFVQDDFDMAAAKPEQKPAAKKSREKEMSIGATFD